MVSTLPGGGLGRVSAAGRGATQDYSRGTSTRRPARSGAWRWALTAIAGGILLVAADRSTLYQVIVVTVTKASVSGHAQHGYALLVIGLAAIALALLAGGRRGAVASRATGLLGLLALAVALLCGDFHDVHSTGSIGALYENARAVPGRGFYLELLGGALLTACGLRGLLARGAGRAP